MEWWQIQELMWTSTGIIVTLVVVSGVTARFLIKPFIGDLAKLRRGPPGGGKATSDLRLDRIEEQLESLGSAVERLADAADFERQLKPGAGPSEGVPKVEG